MQDLSHLAKGLSDGMDKGQWGIQEGASDVDPDGNGSFATMDGDAGYPHKNSPDTIGHDHYKKS